MKTGNHRRRITDRPRTEMRHWRRLVLTVTFGAGLTVWGILILTGWRP